MNKSDHADRKNSLLESNSAIAFKIEEAREQYGMSVAELARRIEVDRKRLWYVLNRQRTMRVDEFLKLCVVLNLSPACFMTKEDFSRLRSNWKR